MARCDCGTVAECVRVVAARLRDFETAWAGALESRQRVRAVCGIAGVLAGEVQVMTVCVEVTDGHARSIPAVADAAGESSRHRDRVVLVRGLRCGVFRVGLLVVRRGLT